MAETRRCWCGSEELTAFDDRYLSCLGCETLVVAAPDEGNPARVRNDDEDFYGRRYWFQHQQELGQPDLEARSVTDLRERCLHWLNALLRFRLPPGRTLELGCAHGGFVSLLADVGFAASGLELSPWVVDFARRIFAVPVLIGPLEDQDLEPGSLDVIVAMDVLEHLPDPEATMRRCVELLSDDGILLIQTPCRPAGKSFEDLVGGGDRFVEMLLPDEHLHLFGRRGLGELLARVGAPHLDFEPAIFAHYDMFVVAGRRPLQTNSSAKVREALTATAAGRRTLAMLDLYREAELRAAAFAEADRDRGERQQQIEELHGLLDADRRDRREAELVLRREIEIMRDGEARSRQTIAELEAVRAQSRKKIERLEDERTQSRQRIDHLENERTEAAAAIEQLDDDRNQARAAAEELRRERDASECENTGLRITAAELRKEIADLDRRLDRLVEIHRRAVDTIAAQDAAHADLVGDAERLRRRIDHLQRQVGALREVIVEHRTSRIYRAMVRMGRWRPYDQKVDRTLHAEEEGPAADDGSELVWSFGETSDHAAGLSAADDERPAIAVDLTALLPGGENGGAKLVAMALVRQMARLAPERRFLLLTSEPCHRELAALDDDNVRRLQVRAEPAALAEVLHREPLSLLLCPMTAPLFADPRVPSICVVHDLQYQVFPEFFSSEERAVRDRDFRRAVEVADRVVTVSEHARRTVLEASGLEPGRVVAIHNGLVQRLQEVSAESAAEILARYGLERRRYLLYPANFWPHKNHRMLLVAFGRLLHRRQRAGIKLVLTGADRPDPGPIREAAGAMGLGDAVVFPGFIPEDELAALMRSSLALIFPSLYEGFGIPVVEAMACGRPVLASDAASLPEVAGDAALLFDPRKPEKITAAIERLLDEPGLAAKLGEKGPARARQIAGLERMASAYLAVIDDVLAAPRRLRDGLFGVHGDGWTAPRFVVSHGTTESPRTLEMELISPPGSAAHPLTLTARSASGDSRHAVLADRPVLRLRCRLPPEAGWVELGVEPSFTPRTRGINADARGLGVKLSQCRLIGDCGETDLLAGARS